MDNNGLTALPAREARPMRCTCCTTFSANSAWMTWPTAAMSRPRAALSVHTSSGQVRSAFSWKACSCSRRSAIQPQSHIHSHSRARSKVTSS